MVVHELLPGQNLHLLPSLFSVRLCILAGAHFVCSIIALGYQATGESDLRLQPQLTDRRRYIRRKENEENRLQRIEELGETDK